MGNWQLEIAKMGLYITFPIGLFYYFNQPQYFEEWVVKTRRKMYPETQESRDFREALKQLARERELAYTVSSDNKDFK